MGSVPIRLARELHDILGLERAVETGTLEGDGARALAEIFETVVTIELSDHYHQVASERLADLANVTLVKGNSAVELPRLATGQPTFYWLDGHWSTGKTAGEDAQCPLLAELAALRPGDCAVIDDARIYLGADAVYRREDWPTLTDIVNVVSGFYVTIANDQIVVVPPEGRDAADRFARWRPSKDWPLLPRAARHLLWRGVLFLDAKVRPR
jgi:hypothetical protein